MNDRGDRLPPTGPAKDHTPREPAVPVVPLPEGPGMGWRWAMTIPVMLFGVLTVWVGEVAVMLWWTRDTLSSLGTEDAFWPDLVENLSDTWGATIIPLLTVAAFVIARGRTIAT